MYGLGIKAFLENNPLYILLSAWSNSFIVLKLNRLEAFLK